MILAFDTSSAACTAALFDGAGECVARADEMIGRGHTERLVPMLDELLDGRKAGPHPGRRRPGQLHRHPRRDRRRARPRDRLGRRALRHVVAGAARGRRRAAGRESRRRSAAATASCSSSNSTRDASRRASFSTSPPAEAAAAITRRAGRRLGRAGSWSKRAAGAKRAKPGRRPPTRSSLPEALRSLPPKPVYARAPDAARRGGGMMATPALERACASSAARPTTSIRSWR